MRTLIPIVIFACLAYAAWFYLQPLTDTPLRENLLLTDTETLREIRITDDQETFRMFKDGATGWVVKQDAIELYDQNDKVAELVRFLKELRTDSVVHLFPLGLGQEVVLFGAGEQREELNFRFPAGSPPLVKVGITGDVFALPPSVHLPLQRMLRFDTYRGRKSLKVEPRAVDSIVVYRHDSLLWRVPPAEVLRLSKAFIAPAAAPNDRPPYADYFDEVMDQEKYFATLTLYTRTDSSQIEVFQDSLWAKPYVLVGNDFPRRYLALDSLR